MKKPKAFTLLELLIAVAIIAILAALLFPLFARGRQGARGAQCASNLRQLGVATRLYMEDNEDRYPAACFLKYLGLSSSPPLRDVVGRYVSSPIVWQCPSDVGEVYWTGAFSYHQHTLPFYDDRMNIGGSSYEYPGYGWSQFHMGELAGLPGSAVRRPVYALLMFEFRPWHGVYSPGEDGHTAAALYNVLHCDGHVARQTDSQLSNDETVAWARTAQ